MESCGAVLFDLSQPKAKTVCLLHYMKTGEWLLAKGRRNCGEHRKDAALREVIEETGFQCHLHPVRMPTRAPPMDEAVDVPDKARVYDSLTEPFMFTCREINGGKSVKLIWWFIAALDHGADLLPGEEAFRPEFFPCAEALEKVTFPSDREVLERAIELVDGSQFQSI